jgi:hypothetical protein
MCGFDHLLILPAVPGHKALFREAIDQRQSLRRNVVASGYAPHRLSRRVDLREMRNEGRASQRELRLPVLRRFAPGDGLGEGLCDRLVDTVENVWPAPSARGFCRDRLSIGVEL